MRWLVLAARGLVLATALASALVVALGDYPIGLDFQGGAHVVLAPSDGGDPARSIDALRATIDRMEVSEPSVLVRGDEIVVELPGGGPREVDRIAAVAQAPRLGIHEVADAGTRHLRDPDTGTDRWILDPPAIGPLLFRDVIDTVDDRGRTILEIELTAAGRDALTDVTTRAVGRPLALVLGDELLMAPVVHEPITGGRLQITPGERELDPRLSLRLRAGIGAPLEVVDSTVIVPIRDPRLGKPLALVVAVMAGLLWLATLASRRAVLAIPATALLVWAATLARILDHGGTFTSALHLQGMLLGVVAASTVAFALRAEDLGARFRAAWPGGVAFLAVVSLALALGHGDTLRPGVARAALRTVEATAGPALLVLALAMIALPSARRR